MSAHSEKILESALSLSVAERAELARQLIDSLDEGVNDDDVEAAWLEEVGRRLTTLEDGSATTVPADEALARVRRRLRGSGQ